MTLKQMFGSAKSGTFHILAFLGAEEIARKIFREASEKKVKECLNLLEYGINKKMPPRINDLYQKAMCLIEEKWPQEAANLRDRLCQLGKEARNRFRITVVQIPAQGSDQKQKNKAVRDTIRILRMYAKMPEDQWKKEIVILNLECENKVNKLHEVLKTSGKALENFTQQVSNDIEKTGLVAFSERLRERARQWAEDQSKKPGSGGAK